MLKFIMSPLILILIVSQIDCLIDVVTNLDGEWVELFGVEGVVGGWTEHLYKV